LGQPPDHAQGKRQRAEAVLGKRVEPGGTFLRDMSNSAKKVELRGRYFTAPYPADTIIEVSSPYSPDALLEIEAMP
jgi:hypothetical protein